MSNGLSSTGGIVASTDQGSIHPRIAPDLPAFEADFDRKPFAVEHNLHELDLFSPASLDFLSKLYRGRPDDYFVASGAPTPGTEFYAVPCGGREPHDVLATLDQRPSRLLFKRPENHDPRFRFLLDRLFEQLVALRPGLAKERIVRLESAIFITSAATTTPFHFDPEIAFFSQIEGEKIYHVFEPDVLSEGELENFYVRNMINIGQVNLGRRDLTAERVFRLRPGLGLHQPQNAPHWVATGASRSMSYSFVFETESSRSTGRARSINHRLRRLGIQPARPGTHPWRDFVKAETCRLARPVRKNLRRLARRVTR